jgi:hypothetical protein
MVICRSEDVMVLYKHAMTFAAILKRFANESVNSNCNYAYHF